MDFLNKAANAALNASAQAAGNPQTQSNDVFTKLGNNFATGTASGYGQQQSQSQHYQQTSQQSESQQHQPQQHQTQQTQQHASGSALGNVFNNALGGGAQGEKNEDFLDKGIDLIQEKIFKAGNQNNESAAEQAKDKMIADAIRSRYKTAFGKDFPIAEKEKREEASPLSGFASAASGFFDKK